MSSQITPGLTPEVVIVTHDASATESGRERLARCIESVRDHTPGVRIILVHNGADRFALITMCENWPEVQMISTVNRGYGAAVNLGVSATRSDRVVVLNDDVVVTANWWSELSAGLDAQCDSRCGAVAPLMLLETEPEAVMRINSAGVRLGSDGAGNDIGYGDPVDTAPTTPTQIEMFSGGAVMVRREMWEMLGGFDTRYFLYYEDVDLALRGAEQGWRYWLIPTSRVIHAQGSTTSDARHAPLVRFLQERNRLWIALRYGTGQQIRGALWLSVRRLRHPPRALHARALGRGIAAAPGLLRARWMAKRQRRAQ
jgi:N-acetylglucosaminyl-diphospho-decaprenol L-rhamnosyltransferase